MLKDADSLRHELQVFNEIKHNNRGSCPFVIDHLGEDLTMRDRKQIVYNLCLEVAWGSLAKYIEIVASKNGQGEIPEHDALLYTADIFRGLKQIHDSGYIHCGLKPDNILLVKNKKNLPLIAKVGDLGLAKKNEVKGRWKGTPAYLAPETIEHGKQEYASDIWAVGLIVLEMLSGKLLAICEEYFYSSESKTLCVVDGWKPKMPKTLKYNAKEFIECCLAEKAHERWTIDELLKHPFVYDGFKPRKSRRRFFSLCKLNCFSNISSK